MENFAKINKKDKNMNENKNTTEEIIRNVEDETSEMIDEIIEEADKKVSESEEEITDDMDVNDKIRRRGWNIGRKCRRALLYRKT